MKEQSRLDNASLRHEPPEIIEGFIEAFSRDAPGSIWFMGWMRLEPSSPLSAAIIQGKRYAASVAFMFFDRSDVPDGCCGVFGFILTDWTPETSARNVVLALLGDRERHLKCLNPLRAIPPRDLIVEFSKVEASISGPSAPELSEMLRAMASWLQDDLQVESQSGVRAAIDAVVLVPGFGCFLKAWVISPFKEIVDLRLRIGGLTLTCDPKALMRTARPDLERIASGRASLLQRAGFVGVFRGAFSVQGISDFVFKIVFEDGASMNVKVDVDLVRLLGVSATLDEIEAIYPSVWSEHFFPDLARASAQLARSRAVPPTVVRAAMTEKVAFFVLSDGLDEVLLQLTRIDRWKSGRGNETAICLVARSGDHRAKLIGWLESLAPAVRGDYGLVFVDNPRDALSQLNDMLVPYSPARFAFMDSGLLLTDVGWDALEDALNADDLSLTILESAPLSSSASITSSFRDICFVWSPEAFEVFFNEEEFRFNSAVLRHGVRCVPDADLLYGATLAFDVPSQSPVEIAVNRSLALESVAP